MAVSQNIRRAFDAVEALEHLLSDLDRERPDNEAVTKLKSEVSEAIEAIKSFIQRSSGSGVLGAKSALSQEGRQRSMGQQRRQARIDDCD
jgi:hypothetical protein